MVVLQSEFFSCKLVQKYWALLPYRIGNKIRLGHSREDPEEIPTIQVGGDVFKSWPKRRHVNARLFKG